MTRKQELNDMNAIACILVILIHVLSLGISSSNPESWQAAVVYFPWRLSAFVVPMFLYTGAVKMTLYFETEKITVKLYLTYCLQRIKKIYIPYVIWVVIYYICFLQIGYVRGQLREFLSYLAIGNLSSPFYYVIIIMQFYFLMPLWIWLIRHVPVYLAFTVSLFITFCMQQCTYVLSVFEIDFPYSDRIFLMYITLWVVGLYTGKYYDIAVSMLRGVSKSIACGAVVFICVILSYIQYSRGLYLFNSNDIKLVSDLLSIALLHNICLEFTRAPTFVRSFLQRVYRSSFFVYLSHCLFLTLTTHFMLQNGLNRLSELLPARFFVCYTVPFLMYEMKQWCASKLSHQRGV